MLLIMLIYLLLFNHRWRCQKQSGRVSHQISVCSTKVRLCFLPLGFSRRGIVMITVSVSVSVNIYTFRTTGRISSRILAKLGMVIGYGSGMMPIVGRSGLMITTVLVHWFLPKNVVFVYFSHWRQQFKLDLNQT